MTMPNEPKPGKSPSTRAAVIMLIIIGIVIIAFVGLNLHSVTRTMG
jgi:hypothetical protein